MGLASALLLAGAWTHVRAEQALPPFLPVIPENPGFASPDIAVDQDLRDALTSAPSAHSAMKSRWTGTAASLTLYDPQGDQVQMLGLGRWDEKKGGDTFRRTVSGGISKDGYFAWHLQKVEHILPGRTEKTLASARSFAYLSANGNILWSSSSGDFPGNIQPVFVSQDGATVLLFERKNGRWNAALYDAFGRALFSTPAGERILQAGMSQDGRYAFVAFNHGQAKTYTFIDAKTKKTRIISAAKVPLGTVSLLDDGSVLAGSSLFLRL